MSSQDEQLRLVAEVVDKYSGPLKQMMEQLKKIGEGSKKVHDEGRRHVEGHHTAYRELREQMAKVKETTTDVLRPAFNALGLSALSVAGGIAAISEAVKGFGEYGEKLEFAHRASGLLMGTVRGLAEANQKYGVSQDETIKGLEKFGENMDRVHRKSGTYMNEFVKAGRGGMTIYKELEKLDGDREAQLRAAMKILPSINNTGQRELIAGLLGLPPNWKYLADKEMQEMRRSGEDWNRNFPFDAEAAKKAKDAWDGLLSTMRGLKDVASGEFAPGLTSFLTMTNDLVRAPEWETIGKTIKDISASFGEWKLFGDQHSVSNELKDINLWLDRIKRAMDLIRNGPGSKDSWWNRPLFSGPNSLLGGSSHDDKKTEDNVRKGVTEGLTDYFRTWSDAQKFANGLTPMAYHPDGGRPTRGGYFGSKDFPAIDASGGGAFSKAERDATGSGGDVPAGSGPRPSGLAGSKRETAKIMTDELRRAGMSKDAIAGIMANVQDESRFNPTLRHPDQPKWSGEAHYAHGLYQEGGAEWNRYAAWLGKNHPGSDWRDPRLQTRFLAENLKQNYPGTWRKMSGQDRFHAAATFVNEYLKPAAQYRAGRMSRYLRGGVGDLESYTGPMEAAHGARLRDMVRRGRNAPSDAELLKLNRRSDGFGGLRNSLDVKIGLDGFPRGTKFSATPNGSIFKEVALNRGRPMSQASETS